MGIVYAVANQKGGVGKTTTAVNVAACVADAGYETLLVDLDAQCNATVGLHATKDHEPNAYSVLSGEATLEEAAIPTSVRGLSLVPSTPDLAGANIELPRLPGSETRLREALGDVRERFLFTILDCPPSLGPLTVNALVAADRVIVPVQTEYFALEGLAGLLDTLSLIQRELNPGLTVAGNQGINGRLRVSDVQDAFVNRHACAEREDQHGDDEAPEIELAAVTERVQLVGGAFRLVDEQDGQVIEYAGEYVEISPYRRLVFTLALENRPHEMSRVVVEIAPLKA